MNSLFASLPTTIFERMSQLAREFDAVNLGQGFPDDPGPEDVRQAAAKAVLDGWNQYPPMLGLPELRQAIAEHHGRFHRVELDWQKEVLVTSGATEALAASLLALIEPGDEVVLFQPIYDAYLPLVQRAGGVARFVTLQPPDWRFDAQQLERAFSPKTRVVLLNTPLNPAGSVVSREDLELLADFVERYDATVICDEVWEHIVFDAVEHTSLLSVPRLRERTVKIGSAGKIFSLTGWKVGLVAAAPHLTTVVARAHQYLTFTTPPNLQAAVAYGLGKEESFFADQRTRLQAQRDRFTRGLEELGFSVMPCRATYFLNVDIAPMGLDDDVVFCERLVREAGVAAIPLSAFYAKDKVTTAVRFCFAKRNEVLDEALERLARFTR